MNSKIDNDPFISLLMPGTLLLLYKHGISYKRLKNSKSNEIAFMHFVTRREFEFKELKNGRYRVSTRFVGYKKALISYFGDKVAEKIDPDGRRKLFYAEFDNSSVIYDLIVFMVTAGFEEQHRIEIV